MTTGKKSRPLCKIRLSHFILVLALRRLRWNGQTYRVAITVTNQKMYTTLRLLIRFNFCFGKEDRERFLHGKAECRRFKIATTNDIVDTNVLSCTIYFQNPRNDLSAMFRLLFNRVGLFVTTLAGFIAAMSNKLMIYYMCTNHTKQPAKKSLFGGPDVTTPLCILCDYIPIIITNNITIKILVLKCIFEMLWHEIDLNVEMLLLATNDK